MASAAGLVGLLATLVTSTGLAQAPPAPGTAAPGAPPVVAGARPPSKVRSATIYGRAADADPEHYASQAPPDHIAEQPGIGSLTPDVYIEDTTKTMRMTDFRGITLAKDNPHMAYLTSFTGYVFKTEDGGKTWDESRLILERRGFFGDNSQKLFFGSQRPDLEVWGRRHLAGGGAMDAAIRGAGGRLNVFRRGAVGFSGIDVGAGGRVSEEANRNVGVGLPGRAPRLQKTIRKLGKVTAGLNIKQTLLLRGVVPTQVRIVVLHPHNPRIAYACTFFGMFMTKDGGMTWVRVFIGDGPRSSHVFHVAVDPGDGKTVLLASGDGMFISRDGGRNFMKHAAQGVGNGVVNWLYFNPYDSRFVFAGTNYGLLRSTDRGRNWEWIYFTTFPTARVVRYVHIDPHDKRTGYIGTHDGPWVTPNILTAKLDDWKRLGGLRFTGVEVIKVTANRRRKGHLFAMTNLKLPRSDPTPGFHPTGGAFLWESVDAGVNWRVIFSGQTRGRISWYEHDGTDPSLLWIVWTRAVARMRRLKPGQSRPTELTKEQQDRVRKLINAETEPTFGDTMMAALRYGGQEMGLVLNYRRGALLKALVPRVDLSMAGVRSRRHGLLEDAIYSPALPYRLKDSTNFDRVEFRGMLTWNLSDLVFNLDRVIFGRVARLNNEMRGQIEWWLQRFYGELRQIKLMMIVHPPKELYVRLHYVTRIEQLESYIDFMTGGYLSRYKRGDRPEGIKTPWFKRWDGTGSDIKQPASSFKPE